jgi:RNA polymerase sigma-70 factor (sigma-E family)
MPGRVGEIDPVHASDLVRKLFQSEYGRIVRLAQYLAGDPDRGEEIAQEAFAALLRRATDMDHPEQAGAYLRQVVVNQARSAFRRRRVVGRNQTPSWAAVELTPDPSGPANDRQVVLAALGRLSRRQRECLVLRYYLDLTEDEIASALGVSAGAVKTHSHRGIAAMAKILGDRP